MEVLDLNIDNYEYEDILKLFDLDLNFGESEIKRAKKKVLMMHPDKSGLDKKYFLFFSSAFKILHSVYEFREKANVNLNEEVEYLAEKNDENQELVDKLREKYSAKDFNEWFNKEFEKLNVKNSNDGYEDWLKSDENMDYRTTTKNNMEQDIYEKKKELRTIIKREEVKSIQELHDNNILGSKEIQEYSSDIFGNFRYDDVKKAYVESVIPVTEEDIDRQTIFNNLQQINDHRNNQNITPLSLEQSNNYLHNMKNDNEEININRAYNLALENEKNNKLNNEWWKNIRQIK